MQAKQAARRSRQRQFGRIAAVLVVVLAAAGISIGLATTGNSSNVSASASSSPSASPTATQLACKYTKSGTAAKNVGVPTYDATTAKQPYTATIVTNQGTITIKMLTTQAPCASYSFKFLAQKSYYNNTKCHRLTTSGIYVLQCGDPTGTGSGSPGYVFPNENLTGATYPAGTVAMANTGSDNTNGSQFFLVFKSGSQLSAAYTPFGTVTSGLDVLTKIAAAGVQSTGSTPSTDGAPKLTVTIEKVTITSG
jgi:peptidyl-prolyl cis-trans isomerase B (cyclophilin B)